MIARRRPPRTRRLWLARGDWRDYPLIGTAHTEYGDVTVFVRVPRRAAVVVALWRVRWDRLVRAEGPEMAAALWEDWRLSREEDGVR